MILWTSGEIHADVGNAFRLARNAVEFEVNEKLALLSLATNFEKWSLIAIILPERFSEHYPEIKRRHIKSKDLEFRLRIDHEQFLHGTPERQKELILEQLRRSVSFMPKFGICQEDCEKLLTLLD